MTLTKEGSGEEKGDDMFKTSLGRTATTDTRDTTRSFLFSQRFRNSVQHSWRDFIVLLERARISLLRQPLCMNGGTMAFAEEGACIPPAFFNR